MSNIELGDLAPLRAVLAWVGERIEQDRHARPADDPGLLALRAVQQRLDDALANARHADLELSVEQYAAAVGLKPWTVYKQIQRGKLPQARKVAGRGIRIPLAA